MAQRQGSQLQELSEEWPAVPGWKNNFRPVPTVTRVFKLGWEFDDETFEAIWNAETPETLSHVLEKRIGLKQPSLWADLLMRFDPDRSYPVAKAFFPKLSELLNQPGKATKLESPGSLRNPRMKLRAGPLVIEAELRQNFPFHLSVKPTDFDRVSWYYCGGKAA